MPTTNEKRLVCNFCIVFTERKFNKVGGADKDQVGNGVAARFKSQSERLATAATRQDTVYSYVAYNTATIHGRASLR
jgi:hypothetical protein